MESFKLDSWKHLRKQNDNSCVVCRYIIVGMILISTDKSNARNKHLRFVIALLGQSRVLHTAPNKVTTSSQKCRA